MYKYKSVRVAQRKIREGKSSEKWNTRIEELDTLT